MLGERARNGLNLLILHRDSQRTRTLESEGCDIPRSPLRHPHYELKKKEKKEKAKKEEPVETAS